MSEDWSFRNQRRLVSAMERVRGYLQTALSARPSVGAPAPTPVMEAAEATGARDAPEPGEPSALESLSLTFGLSAFEEDLLLLCAGVELDASFARQVRELVNRGGEPGGPALQAVQASPTFSLALAVLPGAHWSALSPAAPLRRWRFIELGAGDALMTSPLRIDEWTLHYLTGVNYLDERLRGLVSPAPVPEAAAQLSASQRQQAESAARAWREAGDAGGPLILLTGSDPASQLQAAQEICAQAGLGLYVLRASDIPASAAERAALAGLWEREAALKLLALLIDCRPEAAAGWGLVSGSDGLSASSPAAIANAQTLAEHMQAHTIMMGAGDVSGRGPGAAPAEPGLILETASARRLLRLEVSHPLAQEQKTLWKATLGADAAGLNGAVDGLVEQFNLSAGEIQRASQWARRISAESGGALEQALWQACRGLARPHLEGLAERISPAAFWDDLVLPPAQMQLLHSMAAHVRNRATVYERWGFAARSMRGLGISALFAGVSGTGKTMAAEVLANDLGLDLYRIDLSAVVSKYIGETEKNLRRIFDTAEGGGAILLFDEADALFGKRSEVQDSHDRYANIEVSYLLQRMEAYRGLAILTTNMKSALDSAFLRRIRFIVNFPFPDQEQRSGIWRRIFPALTPLQELDVDKLARLAITGGHIRNIALHAAFLAADQASPVGMAHLLQAARSEYAKLEKTFSENEVRDWITPKEETHG